MRTPGTACPIAASRCSVALYQELTEWRDDLAVILAGQAGPLRGLLHASPPLAARFPAVKGTPAGPIMTRSADNRNAVLSPANVLTSAR